MYYDNLCYWKFFFEVDFVNIIKFIILIYYC